MAVEQFPENNHGNALTPIHSSYTVSATNGEVDKVIIKNFINALAEIALSVASREEAEK
jgi:hypothetical protein